MKGAFSLKLLLYIIKIGGFAVVIIFMGACSAGCPSVCMGEKLAAVNWDGRNLQGAFLVGSDLRNASLGNTNLSNADLSGVDLSGANLSSANLSNARLVGSNLNNASLTGAILSGSNFSGASLVSADLTGETLTSTQLTSVDFSSARLVNADMSQLDLSASTLNYARMAGINLNRSILAGGIIDKADLSGADLRYADFGGAWINLSNLVSANLQNANLSGASLIGSSLIGVNLSGASLAGANLIGADLRGADLRGADLSSAILVALPELISLKNQEDDLLRNMSETQWAKLNLGDALLDGVKYDDRTIWPVGFSIPRTAIDQPGSSSSPAVQQIVLIGSTFTYDYLKPAIKLFMRDNPDTFFVLKLSDSAIAIQQIGSGDTGLGLSSRRLTEKEKSQYPNLKAIQIGADELCVVVNHNNPTLGLTINQLALVYSGSARNWKEFGGPNLAVKALAPELFTSLLLEIVRADVAEFTSVPSDPALKAAVAADPGAVGFLPCKNLDSTIKALTVNGVAPLMPAGSGQNYPLMRPFYLLIPNTPSDLITEWVNFVQNGKGKIAIEQAELEIVRK